MTTVTTTADKLALSQTAKTTSKNRDALGQEDFLKLLTTQLKTQDPFDPVDNTQMVAQMAQFSSVTGIAEMNASLKTIAGDMAGSRLGGAASVIGRNALVASDIAVAADNGSFNGEISFEKAADAATVSLVDANGQVVHTAKLGKQKPGSIDFSWDGKDAQGKAVPGPLKVVVAAQGGSAEVKTAVSTWVPVTGVQSPANGAAAQLITPIGNIAFTDAQRLG